jgi:hypothetical protein
MDAKTIIFVINLVLSLTIVALGIKRYMQSGVKAFALIGLGFLMFALSHASALLQLPYESALVVIRFAGYVLVIVGLVL